MKEKLTIGQLAKLMNVSTHQIRYFEKKGVLLPDSIDENGYRMYGIKEIYILSHILFLRDLDIPVSKIKELFESGKKDNYVDVMKEKIENIKLQIKKLESLNNKINDIVKISETLETKNSNFRIEELAVKNLSEIGRFDTNHRHTALDYYNIIKDGKTGHNDIFYELYDDSYCYICIETQSNGEHLLKRGRYLCYDVIVNNFEETRTRVLEFFDYAVKCNYNLVDKLVIIEDPNLSMFDNETIYIKIQMRIG